MTNQRTFYIKISINYYGYSMPRQQIIVIKKKRKKTTAKNINKNKNIINITNVVKTSTSKRKRRKPTTQQQESQPQPQQVVYRNYADIGDYTKEIVMRNKAIENERKLQNYVHPQQGQRLGSRENTSSDVTAADETPLKEKSLTPEKEEEHVNPYKSIKHFTSPQSTHKLGASTPKSLPTPPYKNHIVDEDGEEPVLSNHKNDRATKKGSRHLQRLQNSPKTNPQRQTVHVAINDYFNSLLSSEEPTINGFKEWVDFNPNHRIQSKKLNDYDFDNVKDKIIKQAFDENAKFRKGL